MTITAAAPRAVVARPIRAALVPLLAMLAGLGVLLAAASLIQLRLGLRPLRRLREEVAAIRTGERTRVDEDQPAELQPLAAELNALTADSERALAAARASAANLAHALKTPVATLALDLADDPLRAAQVARIDDTIRHHLARARVQLGTSRAATALRPAMDDLADAIARIHAERGVRITTDIADDLSVTMDAQDLDEVAGNLVDNAARHARSRVTITAVAEGRQIRLSVIDDGPGIPEADRLRATQAGARLDERGDGHGFGLAIARELAELHGGRLVLDEAPGGGLSATVLLPAPREPNRQERMMIANRLRPLVLLPALALLLQAQNAPPSPPISMARFSAQCRRRRCFPTARPLPTRCRARTRRRSWPPMRAKSRSARRRWPRSSVAISRYAAIPRPSPLARAHPPALADPGPRAFTPVAGSSALGLDHGYVVPGDRFQEIYYWDSYFTMLGLKADGQAPLIEAMLADFVDLVERYGHVPNGTRTYYLSRSQPPFLPLMMDLSDNRDPVLAKRRLAALVREHDYWMAGANCLDASGACAHVVRMPDGSLLNRYWDARESPRDESWREDRETAAKAAPRAAGVVQRDLRAAAESGWDFSSRWLADPMRLETIHTTDIVPVDLNSLLWMAETRIAARATAAGMRRRRGASPRWRRGARRRSTAISGWRPKDAMPTGTGWPSGPRLRRPPHRSSRYSPDWPARTRRVRSPPPPAPR
ncbi:hypothetical protein GCM10020258_11370 [Sphingomonas yabuuchiae]